MYPNESSSDTENNHYTSYYNTLLLPNFTPQKIIIKQYKTLVLRYHPDKSQGDHNSDRYIYEKIHNAYDILKDQKSRHRYDQELQHFLNQCYSITVSLSLSQILNTSKCPITIMIDAHQIKFRINWQTCNWIMGKSTYLVSSQLNFPIQRNSQQYRRVILCCKIWDTIPTYIIDRKIFHEIREITELQDVKMMSKLDPVTTPKYTSFSYKIINFFFYQNIHSTRVPIHIIHHRKRFWIIKGT
jgi:curved DNA-binding protein CbpA